MAGKNKSREAASALIVSAKAREYTIATAESCTGGLVAAAITAIPGASAVLERGFVTRRGFVRMAVLALVARIPDGAFVAGLRGVGGGAGIVRKQILRPIGLFHIPQGFPPMRGKAVQCADLGQSSQLIFAQRCARF